MAMAWPMLALAQENAVQNNGLTSVQPIQFGAFAVSGNGGGTITVREDGTRSSTGDIVLLSQAPFASAAVFEMQACPGKRVMISPERNLRLNAGNGPPLRVELLSADKTGAFSFISSGDCHSTISIKLGAILIIPAHCSPGNYSGNFSITYNQE